MICFERHYGATYVQTYIHTRVCLFLFVVHILALYILSKKIPHRPLAEGMYTAYRIMFENLDNFQT